MFFKQFFLSLEGNIQSSFALLILMFEYSARIYSISPSVTLISDINMSISTTESQLMGPSNPDWSLVLLWKGPLSASGRKGLRPCDNWRLWLDLINITHCVCLMRLPLECFCREAIFTEELTLPLAKLQENLSTLKIASNRSTSRLKMLKSQSGLKVPDMNNQTGVDIYRKWLSK